MQIINTIYEALFWNNLQIMNGTLTPTLTPTCGRFYVCRGDPCGRPLIFLWRPQGSPLQKTVAYHEVGVGVGRPGGFGNVVYFSSKLSTLMFGYKTEGTLRKHLLFGCSLPGRAKENGIQILYS